MCSQRQGPSSEICKFIPLGCTFVKEFENWEVVSNFSPH
ncbi:hypothetical protein CFP56_019488 [Quercus suber]|uniref:Uncharacterized protein n=1 Tax=Quercus suber TaxID=58331 RepID=A0AAW0KH35_QUESU